MKEHFTAEQLIARFSEKNPTLVPLLPVINEAVEAIIACYEQGGRVFCCGNGGSSSDSAHIVGELLKGFLCERPQSDEMKARLSNHGPLGQLMAEKLQGSLAGIDLTTQQAIMSAVANDTDPVLMYAQQLWGLGRKGDVLIGISTSGNAKNVLAAGIAADILGMTSISFTGEKGGLMGEKFNIAIKAPSNWTPEVQEYHIAIYHLLCALVEAHFFEE
ncbi:MAG: SIS domain-containing protein [Ruminococcaceae bacterium]|nr:SIS domain-containing protein [Oscillospiraceae bacterium]